VTAFRDEVRSVHKSQVRDDDTVDISGVRQPIYSAVQNPDCEMYECKLRMNTLGSNFRLLFSYFSSKTSNHPFCLRFRTCLEYCGTQ
jgi:hypothetical protein